MPKDRTNPWIICPICEGDGKYVNPSIDAGGISAETFADDPDFAEEYFSGMYDVACRICDATGKVHQNKLDAKLNALEKAAEERAERMAESGIYESGVMDFRFGF